MRTLHSTGYWHGKGFPAIGERLYQIRWLAGYGERDQLQAFGELFNISRHTLGSWERGRTLIMPHYATIIIEGVPEVKGMTLDYLYRGLRTTLPPDLRRRLRRVPRRPLSTGTVALRNNGR
jgi:transcriptional regulator with XRE-family HTH domain